MLGYCVLRTTFFYRLAGWLSSTHRALPLARCSKAQTSKGKKDSLLRPACWMMACRRQQARVLRKQANSILRLAFSDPRLACFCSGALRGTERKTRLTSKAAVKAWDLCVHQHGLKRLSSMHTPSIQGLRSKRLMWMGRRHLPQQADEPDAPSHKRANELELTPQRCLRSFEAAAMRD